MNKKLLLSIILLASAAYVMGRNMSPYYNGLEQAKEQIKAKQYDAAVKILYKMQERLAKEEDMGITKGKAEIEAMINKKVEKLPMIEQIDYKSKLSDLHHSRMLKK